MLGWAMDSWGSAQVPPTPQLSWDCFGRALMAFCRCPFFFLFFALIFHDIDVSFYLFLFFEPTTQAGQSKQDRPAQPSQASRAQQVRPANTPSKQTRQARKLGQTRMRARSENKTLTRRYPYREASEVSQASQAKPVKQAKPAEQQRKPSKPRKHIEPTSKYSEPSQQVKPGKRAK